MPLFRIPVIIESTADALVEAETLQDAANLVHREGASQFINRGEIIEDSSQVDWSDRDLVAARVYSPDYYRSPDEQEELMGEEYELQWPEGTKSVTVTSAYEDGTKETTVRKF